MRASLKSQLKLHQYLWKLFGSQKEFSNVSLHEELCVPLCGWRILSTNSDTLGRLYLLRLMFVALFGSWKEIVMDNWGRSLLQRVRNCINIVDSGQDTAEKYSWLQRTQKACFGFHSALREAMQNPTCRNGDLQSSCIIFEKSGFWGRVKILGVGGLMSIKREVCTMVWLFWLSYPGDRASGLLLSRPVTSVKHSDNFFLTNSLSPLCEQPQQLTSSLSSHHPRKLAVLQKLTLPWSTSLSAQSRPLLNFEPCLNL